MTELYILSALVVIPLILGGIYVRAKVRRLFDEYSREPIKKGITGGRLARRMLNSAGLENVVVEEIGPALADHYDPRRKVVRLSRKVSQNSSVAAIGIAAHEAAHAMQDGGGYPPAKLRDNLAPIIEKTGFLILPLFFFGILLGRMAMSSLLLDLSLILFLGVVLFYLATLPVEFEASSRAVRYITENSIADEKELEGVRVILRAAALTYVIGTLLAVVQFLSLLGMFRRK